MKKYLVLALIVRTLYAGAVAPETRNPIQDLKARVANGELFYVFEVETVREFLHNHPELKEDFADWVIANSGYFVERAAKATVAYFPPRDEVNRAASGLLLIDLVMSWGDTYAKKIEAMALYPEMCDLVSKYFRGPDPIVKRYNLHYLKNDAHKVPLNGTIGCTLLSPAGTFSTKPKDSKNQGRQL